MTARLRAWAWPLAIAALTLLAYWPALHGGFIWDDDAHVTRPDLRSWRGLGQIWFHLGATQQYYPVLHSAFWVEHRLWGDAVLGYHLVNVLLHAASACLFAAILRRLTMDKAAVWPWFAGLIFALHPVCVESVAWISEQKNTLSTLFYLLSALTYMRWSALTPTRLGTDHETLTRSAPVDPSDHSRSGTRKRFVLYCLATLLFVLALLSKSVTATLPAALLVVLWWKNGRLFWKRDILPLIPWFVLAGAMGWLTAWVERRFIGAEGAAFSLGFIDRVFLAGRIAWFYLGKVLWPARLVFIYPRWNLGPGTHWQLPILVALLALLCWLSWLVAVARRGERGPLAAVLFFLGTLFPALGFFNVYPFLFSYVADHFQYLAALGVIGLAAAAWGRLLEHRRVLAGAAYLLAMAVAVVLGTLTWRESGNYRDPVSFYRNIIERNPGCWMAHNNLGEIFTDTGRLPEAIAQYEDALRLQPDYAKGRFNLGIAYSRARRLPEAVEEFAEAARLKPGWAPGEQSLAVALAEEGRTDEAMGHFDSALREDPRDPAIHADYALALASSGRSPEAIAQLSEAARLAPDDPEIHGNLGMMLAREGREEEALEQFRQVARLQPRRAEAHLNLAVALIRLRRVAEAIVEFRAALALDPDNPEIRADLDRALRLAARPEQP